VNGFVTKRSSGRGSHHGHKVLSQVCLHDFGDGGVCTSGVSSSVLKHPAELVGMRVDDDEDVGREASTKIAVEEL
jgi:hypothetical protein